MKQKRFTEGFLHDANAEFYKESRGAYSEFFPSEQWAIDVAAFGGASVLDVGCNIGGLFHALKERHHNISYCGIDLNSEAIKYARKIHKEAKFVEGVFPSQKLGENKFDSIFCFGTFYHIEDWKQFLAALSEKAEKYVVVDLSMTWDFPTVCDPDVSYQYYFTSGKRVPRTVINVLEFMNFSFTERVGAAEVEFMGTRPKTDGAMTSVPLDRQIRGVAVITKDQSGKPLLGGLTRENDPELMDQIDLSKYRFPKANMVIDGVRQQIYPRPRRED